jgi:RNA polymerase-binding transcription factor DksA
MNTKKHNLLKRAINARLERLRTILSANNNHNQTDVREDESARLDKLSHIPVDDTLISIALQEQARLQANLNWIESDVAGLCQQCEVEIPIQRLVTVPTTRFCISCAKDEVQ